MIPLSLTQNEGPRKTVAVERAEQKHFSLYEKIAAEHAKLAAEREAERAASGNEYEEQY